MTSLPGPALRPSANHPRTRTRRRPLLLERGCTATLASWALRLGGAGQTVGRTLYAALARRTTVTARTAVLLALGGITTGVGEVPDPREARIERLKAQNAELKDRVTDRDATIGGLT
ncbi:hypothetical protein SAMN05446589_10232 [Streptomyces sp. OV198]|nr:hypothetical protein BX281_0859 [Streptomyces sp. Ag82_O1-15]SOF02978.1 hypothetical protein SAMN05446589_10232 [Streptomyces sp. OV198]